jgi:hypothetical protein
MKEKRARLFERCTRLSALSLSSLEARMTTVRARMAPCGKRVVALGKNMAAVEARTAALGNARMEGR